MTKSKDDEWWPIEKQRDEAVKLHEGIYAFLVNSPFRNTGKRDEMIAVMEWLEDYAKGIAT